MKRYGAAMILGGLTVGLGAVWLFARAPVDPVPDPAKPVDLERYLGRWYEFARYPNRFERHCEGVTAEYGSRADGKITVLNTCRKRAPNGPAKTAKGRAKVVPNSGNTKLKVSFFGPFYGNYWVLDHADHYSWSIVGEPSRKYFWILTRVPVPEAALQGELVRRAATLGYDTSRLYFTRQPPG